MFRHWMKLVENAHPEITPQQLTSTIQDVVAHWLSSGRVKDCYDIGSGKCYDFADAVLKALGLDPVWEEYETTHGLLATVHTEDFWKDEWVIDLKKLRAIGEPVPTDIPAKRLASLLGQATHAWISFNGMYYDAETPQGVKHFLDMPFFKRQIDGLRAELQQATKHRRVSSP